MFVFVVCPFDLNFDKKGFFFGNCLAKRRPDVVEWLNNLFPDFSLPLEASCEELRARLLDGFVFFGILGRIKPDLLEKVSLFASLYFLKFMGGIFDSVSDI